MVGIRPRRRRAIRPSRDAAHHAAPDPGGERSVSTAAVQEDNGQPGIEPVTKSAAHGLTRKV
jgi:hypothetical protein